MIKAPIRLQDLRRRIYAKAKAEKSWRFWGLYVHICKKETLREAYAMAKQNNGAPGVDGVTFEAIERSGVEAFLEQIQEELISRTYRPTRNRRKEIPKSGGKGVRTLSIPCIRDRVVQGALKLILEPIFEADFQPGSIEILVKLNNRSFIKINQIQSKNSINCREGKTDSPLFRILKPIVEIDSQHWFVNIT